jgi:hypothetical protein
MKKISSLESLKKNTLSAICSFWAFLPQNIYVFWDIYEILSVSSSIFEEYFEENPDSTLLSEEYSLFLLECATDFEKSISLYTHKILLNNGETFVIDYSFRSFIYAFPFYLRKHIVTINGNLNQNISEYDHSIPSIFVTNTQLDTDAGNENVISRKLMKKPQGRLAFQKCIEHRNSPYSKLMKYFSFIYFVVSIVVVIILFVISKSFLKRYIIF